MVAAASCCALGTRLTAHPASPSQPQLTRTSGRTCAMPPCCARCLHTASMVGAPTYSGPGARAEKNLQCRQPQACQCSCPLPPPPRGGGLLQRSVRARTPATGSKLHGATCRALGLRLRQTCRAKIMQPHPDSRWPSGPGCSCSCCCFTSCSFGVKLPVRALYRPMRPSHVATTPASADGRQECMAWRHTCPRPRLPDQGAGRRPRVALPLPRAGRAAWAPPAACHSSTTA